MWWYWQACKKIRLLAVFLSHQFVAVFLSHQFVNQQNNLLLPLRATWGAQWLSGRVLDSGPEGRGFEPHRHHYVVSLSKNINPSLVLVQPRKTCPFISERLLMGCKESNQTNKRATLWETSPSLTVPMFNILSTTKVILGQQGHKSDWMRGGSNTWLMVYKTISLSTLPQ